MFLRRNEGFTYVEQLMGLFILTTLAILLPNLLTLIDLKTGSNHLDTVTFFNHVANEARGAELIVWNDNRLDIYEGGSVISYELRTHKRIQRYRDGKGVVIMSEGVETFLCNRKNAGLACKVVLESGKTYERSFWTAKSMVQTAS